MAKMSTKKKVLTIVLVSVLAFVLLAGGGLVYFFRDMIFGRIYGSELGMYYGTFGFAPTAYQEDSLYPDYTAHFAEFDKEIKAAMKKTATAEEKALAAYIIYRVGCLGDATALQKAKYSIGSGAAGGIVDFPNGESIQVNGGMNLTATYYTLQYPFVKPATPERMYDGTYTGYAASEEYTQIPKGAVTGNDEAIVSLGEPVLRMALPFARKTVASPEAKIVWYAEASSCKIKPDSATADFSDKKRYQTRTEGGELSEKEAAYTRVYGEDWGDPYGLTARDTSIHVITPQSIIGDTVVITKHEGAYIGGRLIDYYTVEFELDCLTGRNTPQCATYYAELMYQAQAPQAFVDYLSDYDLDYQSLKIELSVFENGYFRTFGTHEVWEMRGNLTLGDSAITATITSDNDSTEAFSYDYGTVMQGFSNRWFACSGVQGIPVDSLPFYSELSAFPPQEYGTYR